MSVGAVLGRMARAGQTPAPPRAWVDDSQDDAVQGSVKDRVVSLPIGMLDAPRAARFFNAVRDGRILRITLAGEERHYALKGSFAALSELVGCAFKARDREITPSNGLPAVPAAPPIAAAPPLPAPAAPNPVMAAMPAAPAVPAPRRITLVNRAFSASLLEAVRRPNPTLVAVLTGAAAILAGVLVVSPIAALFRFGPLHADDAALALGAASLVLLALELLKPRLASRALAN